MQHTAGGHNDEKDILPFSNRLYSCDFAAADHALRLVRLYHKPDAERIILWICAEKPNFSITKTIPFMSPQICYKNR